MKSVRIRSYSGLHIPAFGLNMERYGVSLYIQSKCGKMQTSVTPNTVTFQAVSTLSFTLILMYLYVGIISKFHLSKFKRLLIIRKHMVF